MLDTWFNGQILSSKPEKVTTTLPSQFQIGDDVEVFLDDVRIINAVVFSVRFSSDGSTSYDLAVPISGTCLWSVSNLIRGSMRLSGSEQQPTELIELTKEFITDMRRKSTH